MERGPHQQAGRRDPLRAAKVQNFWDKFRMSRRSTTTSANLEDQMPRDQETAQDATHDAAIIASALDIYAKTAGAHLAKPWRQSKETMAALQRSYRWRWTKKPRPAKNMRIWHMILQKLRIKKSSVAVHNSPQPWLRRRWKAIAVQQNGRRIPRQSGSHFWLTAVRQDT